MISSASVASYAAHVLFWAILGIGSAFGELGRRSVATFLILWVAGVFGLPRLSFAAGHFVTSYVAVLDIVLVFMVFKGDVRMS